ncbi:hypothetical protein SAMN02746041_00061 [Desulfacinum hydrothermale DSM 13146]|uniref:Uncharacterized protein n=1 Tax=Desulfacinum hydrothermale DSM 13146 TaxID=1121390 RepID=A0A1W1WZ40_9BACT|nr:hypothetical protein [Desulfacinum hydrothermale]SMC16401.1 hypothetical protein SAMN02746041_00061 [Desulfacinum hydrothermale DSM 13146]
MICPFCGLQTEDDGPHATQKACREALCRRLEELRRALEGSHEVKLSGAQGAPDPLDLLWEELESVSRRLNELHKIDGALRRARLLGTRSAWEYLMETLEAWRNGT